MTPVVKRSVKRAYRRSCRDGLSWYRGQCFAPQDFPCFFPQDLHSADGHAAQSKPTQAEVEQFNSRNQDRRRLRVLNWNCGGLAVAKLDEIKLWLSKQRIDVAILTETRWTYEGESQDSQWFSIHTGSTTHRGMGILCLISTRLCKQDQLRWRSAVEGRLLHIQLRLGNRNTDIIGCYQFTQASHKARQQDRERWWTSLDHLLGTLARRNMLVLAGDFNCCLPQAHSHTGPAEFRWHGSLTTGATHADSGRFLNVIKTHGLVALNTWNINLGPSFAHANHCSRIDFLITRKPFADGVAKNVTYLPHAPFVSDSHAGHIPMVGHFHRFWIPPTWDNTNGGISQRQRMHGRTECLADSDTWRGFMHDSGGLIMQHLRQASTRTEAFIPDLHKLACSCFDRWFPSSALHRPSDSEGHRLILNKWEHRNLFKNLKATTQVALFQAWYHFAQFRKLKTAHSKHARQVRQEKFQAAIAEAQIAAQKHDMFHLFQIINKYAPKQQRRRMQLRNLQGALATPSEERALLTDFVRQVWNGPETFPTPPCPFSGLPFALEELRIALSSIPVTKSVARTCAPGIVWRQHAAHLAEPIFALLQDWWSGPEPYIPDWWRAGWLLLIPKPNKAPTTPFALRPLALQDPIGKCLVGLLARKGMHQSLHQLVAWPLWAYLPARSTQDPLLRVIGHCKQVRNMVKAQRPNIIAKSQGFHPQKLCGGVQVFIDLQRAFDSIDRVRLFSRMTSLDIDPRIVTLLSHWHQHTVYFVQHNGTDIPVGVGKGVRQGCRAAPWLFNCFLLFYLQELSLMVPMEWILNNVNLYADDSTFGGIFNSVSELKQILHYIAVALRLLQTWGLQVNDTKSAALLAITGSSSRRVRGDLIQRRDSHDWLKIGAQDSEHFLIPIVRNTKYLGAIMSYHTPEDDTLALRISLARTAFSRLLKWLTRRKGLLIAQRLQLWKTCVYSVLSYGICTVGITLPGLNKFSKCVYSMVRQVLGDHAYFSGHSHTFVFQQHGLAVEVR